MNLEQRRRRVLHELPRIEQEADKQRGIKLNPTLEQMRAALQIVILHVTSKQRKVYGGYAIHLALTNKGADPLYRVDDWPDIDFLTPDPTHDIETICKALKAADYSPLAAASHTSTVKIRLHSFHLEAADITYCESGIYNNVPTLVSPQGIHYVAPCYQIIDLYKAFINPITGWQSLSKNVQRATLIEKSYLFSNNCSVKQTFKTTILKENAKNIRDKILKLLQGRQDVVIVDSVAYNMYITMSKTSHRNKKHVEVAGIEMYASHPLDFIDEVVETLVLKTDYEIRVFLPLLELYAQRVTLRVHDQDVLTVFKDPFCIPYQQVRKGEDSKRLQIGSYHVVLRMLYIQRFFCSTNHDSMGVRRCVFMINHLQNSREEWLKRNNKIGLENSHFQELQVECYGIGFLHPFTAHRLRPHNSVFPHYNPEKNTINHDYKFPSSSGRLSLTMYPDSSVKQH